MYWTWEDGDRMLVHTGADTSAFLGRVATDGSTVTTVAGLPGVFRAPAASADGRYEAYVVSEPGGSSAVVVAAGDGSATHEAPVFGPAAFEFAPVAPQLAYIGAGEGDPQAPLPLGPLRIVDAATGDVRQLPANDVVSFFWSPDGSRIATIGISTPARSRLRAPRRPGDHDGPAGLDPSRRRRAPGLPMRRASTSRSSSSTSPQGPPRRPGS